MGESKVKNKIRAITKTKSSRDPPAQRRPGSDTDPDASTHLLKSIEDQVRVQMLQGGHHGGDAPQGRVLHVPRGRRRQGRLLQNWAKMGGSLAFRALCLDILCTGRREAAASASAEGGIWRGKIGVRAGF